MGNCIKNQNFKGFGLLELLAALGVLAIILAVALPNFLGWRSDAQLRSAAECFKESTQLAKSRAMRDRKRVVINLEEDDYLMFVDEGGGSGGRPNGKHDHQEPIIGSCKLKAGQRIEVIDPETDHPAKSVPIPGSELHDYVLEKATEFFISNEDRYGYAGGLFPAGGFDESKVSFKPSEREGFFDYYYDGKYGEASLKPGKIFPNQILFDPSGRCLRPLIVIIINEKGEKIMIKISAMGVITIIKMT